MPRKAKTESMSVASPVEIANVVAKVVKPRKARASKEEVSTNITESYSIFDADSTVTKGDGKEWVMAIDPGKVNFAFLIEEIDSATVNDLKRKCPKKNDRFVSSSSSSGAGEENSEDESKKKKRRKVGKKRGADMECTNAYTEFLDQFYHCGRTVLCANHNLDAAETKKMRGSRCLSADVFLKLTELLDSYKPYLDQCSTIVIEQQMSFGSRINTMAIKIAQHTYSYLLFRYGKTKQIVEFPSYNKTQILGAPPGLEKPQRKKWAIAKADEIWTLRGDMDATSYVGGKKKKDDMSDCLLHVLSYLIVTRFD